MIPNFLNVVLSKFACNIFRWNVTYILVYNSRCEILDDVTVSYRNQVKQRQIQSMQNSKRFLTFYSLRNEHKGSKLSSSHLSLQRRTNLTKKLSMPKIKRLETAIKVSRGNGNPGCWLFSFWLHIFFSSWAAGRKKKPKMNLLAIKGCLGGKFPLGVSGFLFCWSFTYSIIADKWRQNRRQNPCIFTLIRIRLIALKLPFEIV